MNRIYTLALLFLSISLPLQAADQPKNLKIEFSQAMSGHSLVRDAGDQMRAAIIWNQVGLKQFIAKYPIQIEGWEPVFDGKRVFIVAFSDRLNGVYCDGVSHITSPDSASYYIDLNDSGIEFKRRTPSNSKKYSSWVLVSIDRPAAISSFQTREATGGLSSQFGTP